MLMGELTVEISEPAPADARKTFSGELRSRPWWRCKYVLFPSYAAKLTLMKYGGERTRFRYYKVAVAFIGKHTC
jgi:hypothetical protein